MAQETTRRADGCSTHSFFDFLPAEPPKNGDDLNHVLTLAVQYVLCAFGGAACGVEWCTLEDYERFSLLVLVRGECWGDYDTRVVELGFIFRNLTIFAHPIVLDLLDTVREMWWVDGDDQIMHADDVEENWGDLIASLQVVRATSNAAPKARSANFMNYAPYGNVRLASRPGM